MQKAIIGKKIGMTQIFSPEGKVIPVTVIEAGPCSVVQRKTVETDGYEAVQLGFGDVKEKHVTKPLKGHFEKHGVALRKVLKEFRLDEITLNTGDEVKADTFAEGECVDVTGISKGKGYAGVIKRWGTHRLTVPVPFTVIPVQWALAHHRHVFSRERSFPDIWET